MTAPHAAQAQSLATYSLCTHHSASFCFADDAKAVAAVLAGSASSSSPKGVTVEMVSSKHDLVPAQGSSTASPRSMTTRRRKRRLQSTGRSWSSVSDGDEDEFSGLQRNPWTRYGCVRGSRCILHPHGHVKSGWDIIMLPAIFYTATIMPFALAFEAENEGLEVTDWIVYAMFAMDMLIQFVSAYQDNSGHIISDPGAIAVNYLTGWFITDLVSIFPFNSILSNGDASSGGNRLARLARLPRALRMVRVVKVGRLMQLPILMSLWSSLEDTFLSLPAFAAVLRTLGMSALFAHWIACAWHWIGISPAVGGDLRDMQPDESWIAAAGLSERTVAERYIASVYWTLVTMSTVGFGDISPVTAGEQGFTMLVVVIGMLGGGILVADILQVVAAQAKSSNSQRQREDGISHLLRTVAPPKPLRRRLHRWLEDSNKSAESVSDILPQLPASLRRDVLLFARKSLIDSIHFLRELRDNDAVPQGADVVADVVWKLERTTAGPGVILYVQTTPVHGMYFLSKGLVGLLRDGVQVAEMSDGAFFGAAECLFSDTYEATATSMAQTEAYVLPRQAVYELTQKYPMLFGVPLREVALQRMDSFGYTDVLDTGASATGSGIGAGRAHSMGLPQPSTLPAMPPMLSTLPAHLTVPTSSSSDHAGGPGEAPEADPASTSQPPGPPPAPMPVPPPSRAAHLHSQLSGGMGQGGAGARLRRASWSPGGMAHARGTLGRQLSSSQLRGRLRGDMESTAQAREAAQQDGSARVIAAMNKGARAVVMDEVAEEDDEDAEVEEAAAFAGASTQAP